MPTLQHRLVNGFPSFIMIEGALCIKVEVQPVSFNLRVLRFLA